MGWILGKLLGGKFMTMSNRFLKLGYKAIPSGKHRWKSEHEVKKMYVEHNILQLPCQFTGG